MGTNESLCLNSFGQQTYSWCSYQAVDPGTALVQIVFLIVVLLFSVIYIRNSRELMALMTKKKMKQLFGFGFVQIYLLIGGWLICSIVKAILNIFVYAIIMDQQANDQINPDIGSPVIVLSSIFMFLDYCCGFFLLFLMLLIPYHWSYQLLMNTSQKTQLSQQIRIKINRYFTFLTIVHFYFKWIRSLFIALLIIQPFLLFFSQSVIGCSASLINSYILYADTLIILVTFVFAYQVGRFMQKENLIQVTQQDARRIKMEFAMLFTILIIRIIANFVFKLTNFTSQKLNSTCRGISEQMYITIPTLAYQITGLFILHFTTIVIIMYIYRPNVDGRKRDQKILNGQWSMKYQKNNGGGADTTDQYGDQNQGSSGQHRIEEEFLKPSMLSVNNTNIKYKDKDKDKGYMHSNNINKSYSNNTHNINSSNDNTVPPRYQDNNFD